VLVLFFTLFACLDDDDFDDDHDDDDDEDDDDVNYWVKTRQIWWPGGA